MDYYKGVCLSVLLVLSLSVLCERANFSKYGGLGPASDNSIGSSFDRSYAHFKRHVLKRRKTKTGPLSKFDVRFFFFGPRLL